MGLQLTSNQTNTYRSHFIKRFLKTLKETTVLDQFALKEPLPQKQGSKKVTFFVEPDGAASDVLTLAEGTLENSTFSDNNLTEVEATLEYFGDKQKISNMLSLTSFFDRVKSANRKMALSAGYFCDNLIRNEMVEGQDLTGHKRYAGTATTFNALVALTAAQGAWTPINGLAANTQLRLSKATPFGDGDFVTVIDPAIAYDLVQHTKWEEPAKYAGAKQIFKRELGRLYGVRYVETTTPYLEDNNNSTEGSYNAAGIIRSVITLGEEAVGFVELAGSSSPMAPSMNILDKPDKSDPHNQFIVTAWAGYAVAKILAKRRFVVTRCKSTFA